MTRIRVYIATTEGPVAVQKITAEDPDVPSVACRDGTTEVLAISRDYTRFVDRGTGLVAALTGHGAYRLDLDRPVDGGRSWQLPVLLAHLVEAEGRLAGPDEPADVVLLATGEVDRNRRVRPVGRIGEKLAAAGDLIARHAEGDPPLTVLLPGADRIPDLEEWRPDGGGDGVGGTVRILAWERVGSLTELEPSPTGSDAPAHRAVPGNDADARKAPGHEASPDDLPAVLSPPGTAGASRRRRWRSRASRIAGLLLLLLAAAGVGAGATWWNGPRHWETLRRAGDYEALERALGHALVPPLAEHYRSRLLDDAPPPESLVFRLVERRMADGRPCPRPDTRGANEADRADLAGAPVAPRKSGFFRSEEGATICEAVYRVANEGERLAYVYFAVRPALSVTAREAAASTLRRAAALPPGASLTLDLDLGRQPGHVLGADLLVLAAPSPSPQLRRAFGRATDRGEVPSGGVAGSLDLTALPALGLTVKGASHAILR